jgi:hypothetical protein
MANVSRINGFRPVKHITGAPYNGQANLYYVASAADEILVGDIVKTSAAAAANGTPGADLCGVSDMPVGVVVGVMHSKFDPTGGLTGGSLALDLPGQAQIPASGAGYILVCDDPGIIMEVETSNGTCAVGDIGLNASHARGATDATTISSTSTIDMGTEAVTATLNFKLIGFSSRIGNVVGAASAKVLVAFNVHRYGSVGTLGVA